jgi:hypothetical protein
MKLSILKTYKVSSILIILSLFTLSLAQGWNRNISVYSGFRPDPIVRTGISGGGVDAYYRYGFDSIGTLCTGYVFSSPDHTLTVHGYVEYLRIDVESPGDTTLVIVNRQTGEVYCDDDSGLSLNASLALWDLPSGTYDIRVGSYYTDDYLNYTLRITESYSSRSRGVFVGW